MITRSSATQIIYCPNCLHSNQYYALAQFDLLGNDTTHIRSTAQLCGFKSRMGFTCTRCGSAYAYIDGGNDIAYVHKEARFVQQFKAPRTSTFPASIGAALWSVMLWLAPKKYFQMKRAEVSNTKAPWRIVEIVNGWILVGARVHTDRPLNYADTVDEALVQEHELDAQLDRELNSLSHEAQRQQLDDAISEWHCTEGQDRWEARLGATESEDEN